MSVSIKFAIFVDANYYGGVDPCVTNELQNK